MPFSVPLSFWNTRTAVAVLVVLAQATTPTFAREPVRKHTAVQRLETERLAAAHADAQRYAAERSPLSPMPGVTDYKGVFHAHAEDASHTGGTRPEMLADAKAAGVSVIFLSDHFRPPRDYMDSWRGMREGVLFIPGSEMHGFLLHPDNSVMDAMDAPKEDLIAAVNEGTGMLFLSHVEERVAHPMDGLTGMEIYNRHADAKDDMQMLFALAGWMTRPEQVERLERDLAAYPDEILAAQLDYPQLYMEKWDDESQHRPIVGVAANDCHHNQVMILKMADEETALLGTIVDPDDGMRKIPVASAPGLTTLMEGHAPGDVLVSLDFDPYVRSFDNVSTHILAPSLDEPTVRAAVAEGHVYVSHDWMCDPTSFRYYGVPKGAALPKDGAWPDTWYLMGDEAPLGEGLTLVAETPVASWMRLIRNGDVIHETESARLEFDVTEPGTYRVEAWLTVDGEDRVWIYANPLYIQ